MNNATLLRVSGGHPRFVPPARASRGPGRGISVRILDSGEVSATAAARSSPISFPCHTSEKSPANSNHCHTSKIHSRKSFASHTSKTPRGCILRSPGLAAFLPRHSSLAPDSSSFFSCSSTLFCTHEKLNSFVFMQFRTLWQKHPGVGGFHNSHPPLRTLCALCVSALSFSCVTSQRPRSTFNFRPSTSRGATEHRPRPLHV